MADGIASTDLPLASFLDEFLGNYNPGTGMAGPVRVSKAQIAAQISTLISLNTAIVSVLDKDLATPPVSPTTGDRYIVAASATGAWAGHTNDIAEWTGAVWSFTAPVTGAAALVQDEFELYGWNASATAWQTITSSPLAFSTYALLTAVTGAPANIEAHVLADTVGTTSSRARTSNVATIVTAAAHGLSSGNKVNVSGLGGTGYNANQVTVTVVNSTTFTYPNTGGNETTTGDTGGTIDRNGVYASNGAGAWTWIASTDTATLATQIAAIEAQIAADFTTQTIGSTSAASGSTGLAVRTYLIPIASTVDGYLDAMRVAVTTAQIGQIVVATLNGDGTFDLVSAHAVNLAAGVNNIPLLGQGIAVAAGKYVGLYLSTAGVYYDASGGPGAWSTIGVPGTSTAKTINANYLLHMQFDIYPTYLKNVVPRDLKEAIKYSPNILDASAHALSVRDNLGRVVFTHGADGFLEDSAAFIADLASKMSVDGTRDAVARMAQHSLSFTRTDYNGVTIGGQSNAVSPTGATPLSTTQPFNNKRYSGGSLIPYVEPWTVTETCGAGLSSYYSARLRKEVPPWSSYVNDIIIYNMGVGSAALASIDKGNANYTAALAAVTNTKAACIAAGKTYAERAVPFLHGEQDTTLNTLRATYLADLIQLKNDWNTDVLAITGQTDRIPFFIEQLAPQSTNANIAYAMLDAAEADGEFFIVLPAYALSFYPADSLHLTNYHVRLAGEYFGKALYRYYIDRVNPSTVRPLTYRRIDSRTVDVTFYVPVPPLVFDTDWVWPGDAAMGFSAYASGGAEIAIDHVKIVNQNTVRVHTSADIAVGDDIAYAAKRYTGGITGGNGAGRRQGSRGCLRDSDRTMSYYTDVYGNRYELPNWCVVFRKTLTA